MRKIHLHEALNIHSHGKMDWQDVGISCCAVKMKMKKSLLKIEKQLCFIVPVCHFPIHSSLSIGEILLHHWNLNVHHVDKEKGCYPEKWKLIELKLKVGVLFLVLKNFILNILCLLFEKILIILWGVWVSVEKTVVN